MTTCVIYSGEARSFDQLFENHAWHLLRKLKKPEIFVSVQDDNDAPAMERLKDFGCPVHIEYHNQPDIPWSPPGQPLHLAGYDRSTSINNIYRQLWAWKRAWVFYQSKSAIQHENVIRVRPDTKFLHIEISRVTPFAAHVPWWDSWGGYNDRFAVLSCDAAKDYFNTLDWLTEDRPIHPEKLLAEALNSRCRVHLRPFEFVTLRKNGDVLPMGGNLHELARLIHQRV